MATKVVMEALSPTMEEGRLVKWHKAEGDPVQAGEVLAEVETDKAVMELVARGSGVLRARLLAEGATAPVGHLLGVVAAAGEDIGALVGAPPAAVPPADPPAAPPPAAAVAPPPRVPATPTVPLGAPPSEQAPHAVDHGGVRSSPLARRLASASGLDLGALRGTGPGGRIIKRDIEAALAAVPPAAARAAADGPGFVDVPLTQIRKTIARRLAESIGPVPTFYLTAELDVERVLEARAAAAALGDAHRFSVNDFVLKAVATSLRAHPECNAHWLGDRIRRFDRVHLGMAVATEDGLIVPVLFDADRKSLAELSREARGLAQRARERRLTPAEYTGSTFSVSNLGMFGIDQFTAIINPPEAGILAIGAAEPRAVEVNGGVAFRRRMRVTMSCDHRVIDGAAGAAFLQTLRRMVENPLLML